MPYIKKILTIILQKWLNRLDPCRNCNGRGCFLCEELDKKEIDKMIKLIKNHLWVNEELHEKRMTKEEFLSLIIKDDIHRTTSIGGDGVVSSPMGKEVQN